MDEIQNAMTHTANTSWLAKPPVMRHRKPLRREKVDQNYPNPLGLEANFTSTAIPFTTESKGVASMRVMDANGKLILRDFENEYGAGQHFFYFSAKDLPAGTYYYHIEFPKGVVIQNKTMLVVK